MGMLRRTAMFAVAMGSISAVASSGGSFQVPPMIQEPHETNE